MTTFDNTTLLTEYFGELQGVWKCRGETLSQVFDISSQSKLRLHSLCILQGGAEDFFFSGSFFYIPPQGPYKFSEPPKQSAEKLIPPLPPPKKYQNKYLYNSKLYMFEISRDMFNKNIERALTVYVIPMPASLSSAN